MPMEQWYINVLNDVSPDAPMAFDTVRDHRRASPIAFAPGPPGRSRRAPRTPRPRAAWREGDDLDGQRGRRPPRRGSRLREEEGKPFTGILTGNAEADEEIRGMVDLGWRAVGHRRRGDVRGERQHLLAAGQPRRRRVQDGLQDAVNRVLNGQASARGGARRRRRRARRRRSTRPGRRSRSARANDLDGRPPGWRCRRTAHRHPGGARTQPPSREPRNVLSALLFLSPWIVGFLVFTAWPLIYSAYLSLTDYDVINDPNFVGLENYAQLASGPEDRSSRSATRSSSRSCRCRST